MFVVIDKFFNDIEVDNLMKYCDLKMDVVCDMSVFGLLVIVIIDLEGCEIV